MAHPFLQRADVDPVLQMPRRVGVTKFVQEPPAAVRSSGAAVRPQSEVLRTCRRRCCSAALDSDRPPESVRYAAGQNLSLRQSEKRVNLTSAP